MEKCYYVIRGYCQGKKEAAYVWFRNTSEEAAAASKTMIDFESIQYTTISKQKETNP